MLHLVWFVVERGRQASRAARVGGAHCRLCGRRGDSAPVVVAVRIAIVVVFFVDGIRAVARQCAHVGVADRLGCRVDVDLDFVVDTARIASVACVPVRLAFACGARRAVLRCGGECARIGRVSVANCAAAAAGRGSMNRVECSACNIDIMILSSLSFSVGLCVELFNL